MRRIAKGEWTFRSQRAGLEQALRRAQSRLLRLRDEREAADERAGAHDGLIGAISDALTYFATSESEVDRRLARMLEGLVLVFEPATGPRSEEDLADLAALTAVTDRILDRHEVVIGLHRYLRTRAEAADHLAEAMALLLDQGEGSAVVSRLCAVCRHPIEPRESVILWGTPEAGVRFHDIYRGAAHAACANSRALLIARLFIRDSLNDSKIDEVRAELGLEPSPTADHAESVAEALMAIPEVATLGIAKARNGVGQRPLDPIFDAEKAARSALRAIGVDQAVLRRLFAARGRRAKRTGSVARSGTKRR